MSFGVVLGCDAKQRIDPVTVDGAVADDARAADEPDALGNLVDRDELGITKIYPDAAGAPKWASTTWTGDPRTIVADRDMMKEWRDPEDPDVCVPAVGDAVFEVHGDGTATWAGESPRVTVLKGWQNVESTVYAWAEIVGDVEGHGKVDMRVKTDHYCVSDAEFGGYIVNASFKDQDVSFRMEWTHDLGYSKTQAAMPYTLPAKTWIGVKGVVYNLPGGNVKLEAYIDLTDGKDGGEWIKVSETVHDGTWPVRDILYPPYTSPSGGSAIRSQGNTKFKNWTIREISPPTVGT
jgi:hypothetical protein